MGKKKQAVCQWCGAKFDSFVPRDAIEITCFACDQTEPVDRFMSWLGEQIQCPFYDEHNIRARLRQTIRDKGGLL